MKKWFRIGLVTTLVSIIALTTVGAQAPPGAGWWTSFAIQNISDTEGAVTVTAYQGSDGTAGTTYSTSETIALGGALSYHPGFGADASKGRIDFDTSLPSGFIGSLVVQSSVAIVSTGEVGNNQQGTVGTLGGLAKGQYQAIGGNQVANEIRFPVAKNNYFGQTTTFYIQAAGSDASITASFKMDNGSTYTKDYTISANYMVAVSPADAGVPAGKAAGAGSFGALTVTSSTGPIAGVVCEHQHSTSPGTIILTTRGFTPDDLGSKLYAPVIKNGFYNNATTGLTVQNASGGVTSITAVFKVYNAIAGKTNLIGQTYTKTFNNVADGAQVTFRGSSTNTLGGMPAGTLASATITGGGDIVATVNEANSKGKATYSCFNADNATTTVALPQVKEDFFGMTNGVIVQNVDDTASTTVNVAYSDGTNTYTLVKTLTAGEAYSFYDASSSKYTPLAGSSRPKDSMKYAVTVTSQSAAKIVAIAQEADVDLSNGTLDLKNYEGFNLQ